MKKLIISLSLLAAMITADVIVRNHAAKAAQRHENQVQQYLTETEGCVI